VLEELVVAKLKSRKGDGPCITPEYHLGRPRLQANDLQGFNVPALVFQNVDWWRMSLELCFSVSIGQPATELSVRLPFGWNSGRPVWAGTIL
jgi:hypothetical protein